MDGEPPPSDASKARNDASPTSTTDVDNITMTPSQDDPICSSSPNIPVDTTKRAPSIDTEDDLLEINMSRQPQEKITENVDDLVNDLETLLGESSDALCSVADDRGNTSFEEKELVTLLEESNQQTVESNSEEVFPEVSLVKELDEEQPDQLIVTSNTTVENLVTSEEIQADNQLDDEKIMEAESSIPPEILESEAEDSASAQQEDESETNDAQMTIIEKADDSNKNNDKERETETDYAASESVSTDDVDNIATVESTALDKCNIAPQIEEYSEDAKAARELEKMFQDETDTAVSSMEDIIQPETSLQEPENSEQFDENETRQTEQDIALQILTRENEQEIALEEITEEASTYDIEQREEVAVQEEVTNSICDAEQQEQDIAVQEINNSYAEQRECETAQEVTESYIEQHDNVESPAEILSYQNEEEAAVLAIISSTTEQSDDIARTDESQLPESNSEMSVEQSVKTEEEKGNISAQISVESEIPETNQETKAAPEEVLVSHRAEESISVSQDDGQVEKVTNMDIEVEAKNQEEIDENKTQTITDVDVKHDKKDDQELVSTSTDMPAIEENDDVGETDIKSQSGDDNEEPAEPDTKSKSDEDNEEPKSVVAIDDSVKDEELPAIENIDANVTLEPILTSKPKEEIKSQPQNLEEEGNGIKNVKPHTQPLSITVEDEEKEESSKAPHKTQVSEQETCKGSLKMTITKHSDKMHSILKVYDAEEKQPLEQEEEVHEEPIPKLIIKSKQQQCSPKSSSKKCYSPPGSTATSDHTVEAVSPLKITLKTVGKSEEPSRRGSPKLSLKDDSESKHPSPRITIKPIPKPESDPEEHVTSTPKVTIKPVKRPLDVADENAAHEDGPSAKITIRAKPTDLEEDVTHSPKITIKPIKKSDCDDAQSSPRSKSDEEVKERIVLKINKGTVSSKEPKKREGHSGEEEKSEKLAKIKLKFSKEGGHPHIVSPKEGARRHTRSEDVKKTEDMETDNTEDSKTPETVEVQRLTQSDGSNNTKDTKKKEESSSVSDTSAMDTTPVALPTPTPKKRGRPRKNPLVPREESKEPPTYMSASKVEETSTPAPSPAPPSPSPSVESTPSVSAETTPVAIASGGRPKRSCRGQNVMATLGIKPRKPRGRGRGSKVNMGDRLVTENPEDKDTTAHSLDLSQASESDSVKTPDIEPPKKSGRGRRRKISDSHKDTASDTSSVISEAISLDDDDHMEPKDKVPKKEREEDDAELAKRKREKLLAQLAKAREKRKYLTKEQKNEEKESKSRAKDQEENSKESQSENSGDKTQTQATIDVSGDNSAVVNQQEENKNESFGTISNVSDTSATVDKDRPVVPQIASPEKLQTVKPEQGMKPEKLPISNSAMEVSSGLPESLVVDEETRMSADQGFREATPAKQVLSSDVGPEDSQSSVQSTGTTESGKTGGSVKNSRTRLEVNQELDSNVVTVDQIAEYFWDNSGPFMLQEQVSLYLSITSFKRKYPNIARRGVDMQERNYLRENGLASEAMCNLGLTAVSSHDIIDIMYRDFQDKYEEYCRYTQEKQAKELLNKQKVLSQQSQIVKNFDKTELMEQAIQSTVQWNKEFNKTRQEQRKASMDLQTYTVQYPKGRMRQLKKPDIGSYPVALVPGQFTDYYKDLTAMDINNLPLNSLGTGYFESSDVDSDSSEDDSDSSSTSSSSDYSSDEDCKLCAKHSSATKTTSS